MLVPTSVTTRLTSRLAVSLPTLGSPSPVDWDWRSGIKTVVNAFTASRRACTQPNQLTPIRGTRRLRGPDQASGLTDFAREGLCASQDLPVDELPEGGIDPRLHLGFLPVPPQPSGLEGVLRP